MDTQVKKLGVITLVLFVVSLGVHFREHSRRTGFVAGQDFLVGFNVDKVHKIKIQRDKDVLEFDRDGKQFVLANHHAYPAAGDKINELLFKMAKIQVLEEVTEDSSKFKTFKVDKDDFEIHVQAMDSEGNGLADFYVGKNQKGRTYIRHAQKDKVYLTAQSFFTSTDKSYFVDKKILKLDHKEISQVVVSNSKDLVIRKKAEDDYEVSPKSKEKLENSQIKKFLRKFENLSFTDYLPQNDPKVLSLGKKRQVKIDTEDGLQYALDLFKTDKKFFLKARSVSEFPSEFKVQRDADKEQLEKIEQQIQSKGHSQRFNLKHGPWVYEITDNLYNTLIEGPK